jgi:hypothetical protein
MPRITGASVIFEKRFDSSLYVVLEYSIVNEDPSRYALSTLDIYVDGKLLESRGMTSDESRTDTEPLYIDSPPQGSTLRFDLYLVGYDRLQPPPKTYTTWDSYSFTYTVRTAAPTKPTTGMVTLYTEPMLTAEETLKVSARLDSYTLTVGRGVSVPLGSYTLTVVSLPEGYQAVGAYGTGGVSVSGWSVSVQGDGNIVLRLTYTVGAAPPPAAPTAIHPILVLAAIGALAYLGRGRGER